MKIIDADELRKTMYHEAFETDTDMQKWDSGCWIRYKMFLNALQNAPAIEAEPIRHGHWINDKGLYRCSACNEFATIAGFANCIPIEQMNKAMKYCNTCGAKMDEVKDV